jgi:hypothetical protein
MLVERPYLILLLCLVQALLRDMPDLAIELGIVSILCRQSTALDHLYDSILLRGQA